MAFEINFTDLTAAQRTTAIEIMQKITGIEGQIADISDERANAEAVWRKKENFLNTEKGKLQIQLRELRKGELKETV